ncbi:AAA family ATPase [Janthinobacterium sp. RB2R34]|uniref:AAA family ATPase n=1 Tax=Janthinobacterium sp. RB2R34 TaxID=3424193 RepID=UPI003F200610
MVDFEINLLYNKLPKIFRSEKKMLVGVFLRHYKIYRAINFIPISSGAGFSAYLGANGSGKSSILDALDKFFNGGEWSINAQAKSEGGISGDEKSPFIMPIFLVPREKIKNVPAADALSSYLWTTNYRTVDAHNDFYDVRLSLIANGYSNTSHYLLPLGKQHGKSNGHIASFGKDPTLIRIFEELQITESEINHLLSEVLSLYAYFYIPVEADASLFSAIESRHVQKLLDEDIKEKIQKAIGSSTVSSINTSLQQFVNEIGSSLKNYEYKGSYKNKLTMNDLVEKVFEAYFSIKILHGKQKGHSLPVREMSAGEKRRALIDLSYSLLARSATRSHTVILAIDEPDASLHTSACHDQFAKLAEIPDITSPPTQVLVTTHWYGFLPIVQNGVAHAISHENERNTFYSFDLYNFREQIKHTLRNSTTPIAIDVELKSYNDMIQSIVSSAIRPSPYNWILCEGLSDKIYLEYYLAEFIEKENLRIIPLGGYKEVRRTYDYLWQPLNDPAYRTTGKVLCLIDTDARLEAVVLKAKSASIQFSRIIYEPLVDDCVLVNVDDQRSSPATEIEQALNATHFVDTVSQLDNLGQNSVIKEIVASANINSNSASVFGHLDLGPLATKKMMEEYFDKDDNKVKFARQYVARNSVGIPLWVTEVADYFRPRKPRKGK